MLRRISTNTAYPINQDAALLTYASKKGDVIGTQELRTSSNKPFDIGTVLFGDWADNQILTDSTTSATCFAWRVGLNVRFIRSSQLYSRSRLRRVGKKVQMRYYSEITTEDPDTKGIAHEITVHIPLRSTGMMWIAMRALKARINWLKKNRPRQAIVVYIDSNMPIARAAKFLGLTAVGKNTNSRIVGHLVHRIDVVEWDIDHEVVRQKWTDHPLCYMKGSAWPRALPNPKPPAKRRRRKK